MQYDGGSTPESDRQRPSVWSWLKNPWLVLVFGSITLLGLWIGLGEFIEYQRHEAERELESGNVIQFATVLPNDRFPVWLPDWLGRILPEDLQFKRSRVTGVRIVESQDDRDVRLLSRIGEIESIEFHTECTCSDDALLELTETHRLRKLCFWQKPRKLTAQHLAELRQHGDPVELYGLAGPFGEQQLGELAGMSNLQILGLNGPIEPTVRLPVFTWPQLSSVGWDESQIADEQLASMFASSPLETLYLEQTQLTPQAWPLLDGMPLGYLRLEGPHIDDALLKVLTRIPSLYALHLPKATITDAGVRVLSALTDLNRLELDVTGLTVTGARHLGECKKLGTLSLRNCSSVTR